MAKNVINSVSYPVEMQKFLDENPDLSLSKMLQSKIIEIMENRRLKFEELNRLKRVNQTLQTELLKCSDELEKSLEKIKLLGAKHE